MKKSKKLLSLLLAVLLLCSLLPAAASAEGNPEDDYPFVFVHGLMGWGERSMLDPIMPYWGMTTGNLMKYLNSKGYESYAAQVGPLSGAWDRACELYAQLVGGTVDYGAAHSAAKGHDRYGITYEKPLLRAGARRRKSILSDTASAARRRACSSSCLQTAARKRSRPQRRQAQRYLRCLRAARATGCIRSRRLLRRTTEPRLSKPAMFRPRW